MIEYRVEVNDRVPRKCILYNLPSEAKSILSLKCEKKQLIEKNSGAHKESTFE